MRFGRLALILASALLAGLTRSAPPPDLALEARVRRAVEATYVHGMNDAIAQAEVGRAGVPILLRLLFEPDLPRRDNVVAFLAHLDEEGITPPLVDFLDQSPGVLTDPNEERALLLVPLALARRAAQGDAGARSALVRLASPGLSAAERPGPSSLAPLLKSQAELALARAQDPEALRGTGGPSEGEVAAAFDTHARRHTTAISVANHVDLTSKITNTSADGLLERMSEIAGEADFPEDVACCTGFARGGNVANFGTAGDGLDSIDSESELIGVLDLSVSRVKVVRVINYCSRPGTNIIGCSYTPGFGMAVVRTGNEGALWLHEYGHNAGLGHVSDSRNVMYAFLVQTALGLTQSQCNTYHAPDARARANPQDVGACTSQTGCTDADRDGYGSPGSTQCAQGSETDCNDTNPNIHPERRDLCNRVDNDCDGAFDEDAICRTFDVNNDGRVAGPELAWIGRAFGLCSGSQQWWTKADYDADGCVDGDDLAILSQAWNCTGTMSICR